ncbi:MAG TPA: hypothetical protein VGQ36_20640 [Thermoanaerobaculia bacterium]|jgi:hypothetical protein|nr:hypothetical protein [Thermoanaerobaculia bacterium]
MTERSTLSEGLLLGAITVTAYACAFAYEAGQATFYGYPFQLIRIDLSSIFIAVVAVFLTLSFVIAIADLLIRMPWPDSALGRQLGTAAIIAFFVTALALIFRFSPLRLWLTLYGFVGAFLLLELIMPALFIRGRKYQDKLERAEQINARTPNLVNVVQAIVGEHAVFWAIGLVALMIVFASVGLAVASRERLYLVIPGTPERAVLRIYGTTIISAELERKQKLFKRHFTFDDVANASVRAIREEIGPLKAAAVILPNARRTTPAPEKRKTPAPTPPQKPSSSKKGA